MSLSAAQSPPDVGTPARTVPPLVDGERLSLEEFRRRYEAMPHVKKAELIEGVVYMSSPVNTDDHANPHGRFMAILGVYEAFTPGVRIGDNSTVRLDTGEQQPDGLLYIEPECGGKVKIVAGDVVGGPELAAEIAASSKNSDLGPRFQANCRNGVQEYVVWRVLDRAIDWFVLRGSEYQRMQPTADGVYRSEVFPGLWLDAEALLSADLARVHAVLQLGLASPEHQEFIARLRAKKAE